MALKYALIILGFAAFVPATAFAQGTLGGAAEGADRGAEAGGPVGAVVGGAVGAATGTVGGVLGVPADRGCETRTTRRENGYGDSETVRRSNCP